MAKLQEFTPRKKFRIAFKIPGNPNPQYTTVYHRKLMGARAHAQAIMQPGAKIRKVVEVPR